MAGLLEPAFKLAYFIWPETEAATGLVTRALAALPGTITLQYKRLDYGMDAAVMRSKVILSSRQVVQYLLLLYSERLDVLRDRPTIEYCDEMTVLFIAQIARRAIGHNSFYACVGMSRVLCDFETAAALDMFMFVSDDRPKEDSECRRVRSGFFKALERRFGSGLTVKSVERGEKQFVCRSLRKADKELARECMKRFTLWDTPHLNSNTHKGVREEILNLSSSHKTENDQDLVELNRMHVFLDPQCFERLLTILKTDGHFEEKLMLPDFDCDNGDAPTQDRSNPPPLNGAETQRIMGAVKQQAMLRQAASSHPVRIRVDGIDRGQVTLPRSGSIRVTVNKDADVVELVGFDHDDEVVIATYILTGDEDANEANDLELELPLPDLAAGSGFGGYSDYCAIAIDHLLAGTAISGWEARLQRWRDWLHALSTPLLAPVPSFGFASELRAGLTKGTVYEAVLTPSEPACRIDIASPGEIRAGVDSWPVGGERPLVLLIPQDKDARPTVVIASPDAETGLLIAHFAQVGAGAYVLCLEPIST